jgi:hypothetical protein
MQTAPAVTVSLLPGERAWVYVSSEHVPSSPVTYVALPEKQPTDGPNDFSFIPFAPFGLVPEDFPMKWLVLAARG